jgi:hypothetical protein
MVGLAEEGTLTWYPNQEISISSPTTHIPLCVIILTYRSSYGGARITQTSGPQVERWGPGWHAVEEMLEHNKKPPSPLLYYLGFMVGLTEDVLSSMVSEPRSWIQFPPATHFLSLRVIIHTYLAISLSTHMSRAHGRDSHAG